MRKTFPLTIEGRNRERVLDAVKHHLRNYLKRERRREMPEGMDFWDFGCRIGVAADAAQPVHVAELTKALDTLAREGAATVYVEILARAAKRTARAPQEAEPAPAGPAEA